MHEREENEQREHPDAEPEKDRPLFEQRRHHGLHVVGVVDLGETDAEGDEERDEGDDDADDGERAEREDLDEADERELPVRERVLAAALQRLDDAASHSRFRR
ncbi:MAG: hypothetical protein DMF56_14030 [Acidobacteria bacterium]|nr:MAG: hypothetical protein DMF56_14030 [Acidobacteriota bacterium]